MSEDKLEEYKLWAAGFKKSIDVIIVNLFHTREMYKFAKMDRLMMAYLNANTSRIPEFADLLEFEKHFVKYLSTGFFEIFQNEDLTLVFNLSPYVFSINLNVPEGDVPLFNVTRANDVSIPVRMWYDIRKHGRNEILVQNLLRFLKHAGYLFTLKKKVLEQLKNIDSVMGGISDLQQIELIPNLNELINDSEALKKSCKATKLNILGTEVFDNVSKVVNNINTLEETVTFFEELQDLFKMFRSAADILHTFDESLKSPQIDESSKRKIQNLFMCVNHRFNESKPDYEKDLKKNRFEYLIWKHMVHEIHEFVTLFTALYSLNDSTVQDMLQTFQTLTMKEKFRIFGTGDVSEAQETFQKLKNSLNDSPETKSKDEIYEHCRVVEQKMTTSIRAIRSYVLILKEKSLPVPDNLETILGLASEETKRQAAAAEQLTNALSRHFDEDVQRNSLHSSDAVESDSLHSSDINLSIPKNRRDLISSQPKKRNNSKQRQRKYNDASASDSLRKGDSDTDSNFEEGESEIETSSEGGESKRGKSEGGESEIETSTESESEDEKKELKKELEWVIKDKEEHEAKQAGNEAGEVAGEARLSPEEASGVSGESKTSEQRISEPLIIEDLDIEVYKEVKIPPKQPRKSKTPRKLPELKKVESKEVKSKEVESTKEELVPEESKIVIKICSPQEITESPSRCWIQEVPPKKELYVNQYGIEETKEKTVNVFKCTPVEFQNLTKQLPYVVTMFEDSNNCDRFQEVLSEASLPTKKGSKGTQKPVTLSIDWGYLFLQKFLGKGVVDRIQMPFFSLIKHSRVITASKIDSLQGLKEGSFEKALAVLHFVLNGISLELPSGTIPEIITDYQSKVKKKHNFNFLMLASSSSSAASGDAAASAASGDAAASAAVPQIQVSVFSFKNTNEPTAPFCFIAHIEEQRTTFYPWLQHVNFVQLRDAGFV